MFFELVSDLHCCYSSLVVDQGVEIKIKSKQSAVPPIVWVTNARHTTQHIRCRLSEGRVLERSSLILHFIEAILQQFPCLCRVLRNVQDAALLVALFVVVALLGIVSASLGRLRSPARGPIDIALHSLNASTKAWI